MLSLPLAFILSQDQTLHCIISINLKSDPAPLLFIQRNSRLLFQLLCYNCLVLLIVLSLPFFQSTLAVLSKRAANIALFLISPKKYCDFLKENLEKTRVVLVHIYEDMADDGVPYECGLGFDAVLLAIPVNRRLLLVVEKDGFAIGATQLDLPVAHSVDRNGVLLFP